MSETAQFQSHMDELQIPLLNQAEGPWGISHWSVPIYITGKLKYLVLSPQKGSQKQVQSESPAGCFPSTSPFSLLLQAHCGVRRWVSCQPPPRSAWPGKAQWLEPVDPRMQMPVPGVGHPSFRGHSLRSHKMATPIWAKRVSSLMTQDGFSEFGFVFQALEILRCHQCLTATHRAPFCVTTGTQEPFLGPWAETAAHWHFWLGSLKSPLLFLIVLIT